MLLWFRHSCPHCNFHGPMVQTGFGIRCGNCRDRVDPASVRHTEIVRVPDFVRLRDSLPSIRTAHGFGQSS